MKAKKGIFGYTSGILKSVGKTSSSWFDAGSFLVSGQNMTVEDAESPQPVYWFGRAVLVVIGAVLIFQLTNLQITQGRANQFLAQNNSVRRQISVAPRGTIVDRNGQVLASNEPGYVLNLIPSDLPYKLNDRLNTLQTVASVIGDNAQNLEAKVVNAGLSSVAPITIRTKVQRDDALVWQIKFASLPGVQVAYVPTRQYDATPGLAPLLGYTSQMTTNDTTKHPDYFQGSPIGRSGLEASYDTDLRGTVGINEIEVNANGQIQRTLNNTPPVTGNELQLTIDKGLEQATADALTSEMSKEKVQEGVAIAMDPQTGGILASVSLPSYNDNLFANGISSADYNKLSSDPLKPLLDKVTNGIYPSGSTIKPFLAAAALQEGTITPTTMLDTSAGKIQVGSSIFPDWKVHGITNVINAIAQSNDIFFYSVGGGYKNVPGLGIDRIKKYLDLFGFGQSTGVDFTTDASGLVPDPTWKKATKNEAWYLGDTYHVSIGQGDLLVTPLQLARGYSAIVNGGKLVTPHLVNSIVLPDGQTQTPDYPTTPLNLSQQAIATTVAGLQATVASPTGSGHNSPLKNLPFTSGGKTGTAQYGSDNSKTHAWYVGFAPADNPKIVVAVLVPGGGEGNAVAIPVAAQMMAYYMAHQ